MLLYNVVPLLTVVLLPVNVVFVLLLLANCIMLMLESGAMSSKAESLLRTPSLQFRTDPWTAARLSVVSMAMPKVVLDVRTLPHS